MRKILIVEDDEKLCRELQTFLMNNGYQAESLPTGEYGIPSILNVQPDLIPGSGTSGDGRPVSLPGASESDGASGHCDYQPGHPDGGANEP